MCGVGFFIRFTAAKLLTTVCSKIVIGDDEDLREQLLIECVSKTNRLVRRLRKALVIWALEFKDQTGLVFLFYAS